MDIVEPRTRSRIMASVRQVGTRPELIVRSLLHRAGFRFRLHRRDLPGSPDIVLPRYRVAIFVHGCFWHGHAECRYARRPTSNVSYWDAKLDENLRRDRERTEQLQRMGWHVLVVWQCETKDTAHLREWLVRALQSG